MPDAMHSVWPDHVLVLTLQLVQERADGAGGLQRVASAIEPPFGLTWPDRLKACMKRSTTEAKASFTSKRSMLPMEPCQAVAQNFSVTGTGPVSMIVGSVPILAVARTAGLEAISLAEFGIPRSGTAPAPSTMPEVLQWC